MPEPTTGPTRFTQAELIAEARTRFGDNSLDWAFVCPNCHDTANGHDFVKALADHPRKNRDGGATDASDLIGQECIGRTLGVLNRALAEGEYSGRGCDWAAYGLLAGPWAITLPNGRTVHSFALAPAEGETP